MPGGIVTVNEITNDVTVELTPINLLEVKDGPPGPIGPIGPIGPPGAGANWRGVWSDLVTYAVGDGVQGANGHNYVSVVANNLNHNPITDDGSHWSDLLPNSVTLASSPLGDPMGRTQVMQTSTIAAPSLRQFVFVDDAPFNAKGDARRLTDGSMTSGSNQLHSTNASFTSADVGKVVEVIGASSNATHPSVVGYVGSVTSGVASIVTTSGGSTPANATATISNATFTYGTNDTASIVAASNAVSDAGGGTVAFSSFKTYWFTQVYPASNVTYDGRSATFYVLPLPEDGVNPNSAFSLEAAFGQCRHKSITNGTQVFPRATYAVTSTAGFPSSGYLSAQGLVGTIKYTGISGNTFTGCTGGSGTASNGNPCGLAGVSHTIYKNMVWVGHGSEIHNQFPLFVHAATDQKMYDCHFYNYPQDCVYWSDTTECRVVDNTFTDVCGHYGPDAGGSIGNPLNMGAGWAGDVFPMTRMYVAGNHITGCISECINFGGLSAPGRIFDQQVVGFHARIIGNYCQNSLENSAAIWCENGGDDYLHMPAQSTVIANNVCDGGNIIVDYDGSPGVLDSTRMGRTVITGNVMQGGNANILFQGQDAVITGNELIGMTAGITVGFLEGAPAFTGTLANGSPTVTGVAGDSSHITIGTYVTGTGIPECTWITNISGTTWTLSQNATVSGSESLTAKFTCKYVNVADNHFHVTAGNTNANFGVITAVNVQDSSFTDNTMIYDQGVQYKFGMAISGCFNTQIKSNIVEWSPHRTMQIISCHDISVCDNDIYNCSSYGANTNEGILFYGVTGKANLICGNRIVDDRSSPKMYNGISFGFIPSTNTVVHDNVIIGATNLPVEDGFGTCILSLRDNITDKPPQLWPQSGSVAPSVGASPWTYTNNNPYPQQFFWSGGSVSQVVLGRGGILMAILVPAGGAVVLQPKDYVIFTYSSPPTAVNVLPLQ